MVAINILTSGIVFAIRSAPFFFPFFTSFFPFPFLISISHFLFSLISISPLTSIHNLSPLPPIRIRLVGVDTPESGELGYEVAKSLVEEKCLGKKVYFDIEDCKQYDEYHRILAVIYVNVNGTWINLNAELLKEGYAKIMYIPPSEFNPDHGERGDLLKV